MAIEDGSDNGNRRLALQAVDDCLCELAANILRSVRGAGKPDLIGRQAQSLADAMVAYRDVAGQFPGDEALGATLDIGTPDDRGGGAIHQPFRGEVSVFRHGHAPPLAI